MFYLAVKNSLSNIPFFQERSFEIDFENNTFMKDGLPFQYISGSFHYFRSLPETWREKLRLMRIAGINAVDM